MLRLLVVAMTLALAAPAAADERTDARVKFFGAGNVDPATGELRRDRVVLSWFGVSSFALGLDGHVLLLDAWVPRGPHSGYVPTTPAELAALDPEAVLIGHGHFDHAADAHTVLAASDAALVGTPEHCDLVTERMAADGLAPPRCVKLTEREAAIGSRAGLPPLGRARVTALRHVHSAAEPPDPDDPQLPVTPLLDPLTILTHPPDPESVRHLAENAAGADEGGSLLYQFRLGDFALTWHDTSGPMGERAPELPALLAGLPATDVQLGAISSLNQVTNGYRDPRRYIEALAPALFVPTHHDDYLVGVSAPASRSEAAFRAELARMPEPTRPQLTYLRDPGDYLRPEILTFDVRPVRAPVRCRARQLVLRLDRRFVSARVTAAGRTARIRGGRRLRAVLDLRGVRRQRVRVRIVGRTRAGARVVVTRTHRTCRA